jgi:hypothetical protein
MMALVQNPRGGYTESLGGVGDRFMIDSIPQVAAVAEAKATDSWYTQLYYLPQVNVGPVKLASTFEMYLPNQRAGTVQLVLAPASVYVSLTHTVGLGVLYQAAFEPNHAPHDGLGPAVSIAIPHGTLELGFLRGISDFTDEVRAQVTITY